MRENLATGSWLSADGGVREDVTVGFWRTVKFSGALPAKRVNELLERVEKLQEAVKFAREEANNAETSDQKVGDAVFKFLIG